MARRQTQLSEDERLLYQELSRWLAHVTTLAAGSIVVIATFAQKFSGQGPGALLALAVVGFAVAIVSGLFAGLALVLEIEDEPSDPDATEPWIWAMIVMGFAFAGALISLAAFAAVAVT